MTVIAWIAALFSTSGAAVAWRVLRRFNPTSHGANPYNLEGAFNVLRLFAFYDRAVALVKGRLTSCFRSARVNDLVGGVKPGPGSRGSRHMRALAIDVVPGGGLNLDQGMALLYAAAKRGELGPLRQLIKETAKGVIHCSFSAIDEVTPPAPELLEQPTREPNYIPYSLRAA